MTELLWIKSLLNFQILCLCGLILGILFKQKEKVIINVWVPTITIILIINLWGCLWSILRFTGQFHRFSELLASLQPFYICFNFLLGPILLLSLEQTVLSKKNVFHWIPALLSLGLFWTPDDDQTWALVFSLVHFLTYAFYIVFRFQNKVLPKFGWSATKMVVGFWAIGYFLHLMELVLWSQLLIISELSAWVLYVISQLIIAFSLFYLSHALASKKSKFTIKEQTDLPKEVLNRLDKDFLDYINNPEIYTNPLISQNKVAKALNVSSYHISRYLNHHLGDTFINTINSSRIKASQELINSPESANMTLKDICYQVGFNSRSTFNTAFKFYTGLTPSEYRARLKH